MFDVLKLITMITLAGLGFSLVYEWPLWAGSAAIGGMVGVLIVRDWMKGRPQF